MAKKPIIIGLDIGTENIKILGAKSEENTDLFRVVFFEIFPSMGVNNGRIRDDKLLNRKLIEIINKVEEKYNVQVDNVITNIGGSRVELVKNKASISVGGANGRVSEDDKERVKNDAKAIKLSNKSILDLFVKEWILDGDKDISDPLGLTGIKLELEASILTCFARDKELIENVLIGSDINSFEIIPTPFADAEALLDDSQKDLGVILVNVGAKTTSMVIYENGKVLDFAIFPVGSASITNDIAVGLTTEINIAEKIKQEYGACLVGGNKKIEIYIPEFMDPDFVLEEGVKRNKRDVLVFTEKLLKNIIEARTVEILGFVKERIDKVNKTGNLPVGIILTGGGANMKDIEEVVKKQINLPCRIACSDKFIGLDKNPSYSTVCGLVMFGETLEGIEGPNKGPVGFIRNILMKFLP